MYSSHNKDNAKAPRRYLKFWGDDYPYLGENKNSMQRWLPVPVDSESRRIIGNINRDSELMVRGDDFIMSPANSLRFSRINADI